LRILVTDFNPDRSSDSNPGCSPLEQPTPVFSSGSLGQTRDALERLTGELEALALPARHVLRINVPLAVANCTQVAASFRRDRERFDAVIVAGGLGVRDDQDLVDRARALWQADVNLRNAEAGTTDLQQLLAEATSRRRVLLQAAVYLWEHDPTLAEKVQAIRAGRGHLDTADDLVALASLFQDHWEEAQAKTRVREQDLERATEVANLLIEALRRSSSEEKGSLRSLRQRAAYYAMTGVETVRLAAALVFRQEPERLEDYPSFHKRGKPARRASEEGAVEDAAVEEADTPDQPSETERSEQPAREVGSPTRIEAAQPIDGRDTLDAESRAS
jgi:hypothetical protein